MASGILPASAVADAGEQQPRSSADGGRLEPSAALTAPSAEASDGLHVSTTRVGSSHGLVLVGYERISAGLQLITVIGAVPVGVGKRGVGSMFSHLFTVGQAVIIGVCVERI